MLYKETTKLFHRKYQYRIVLVCTGVGIFRGNNLDLIWAKLQNYEANDDRTYLHKLYKCLESFSSEYALRVETPWLSIYTNNTELLQELRDIDLQKVKYIYRPTVPIIDGEIVSTLPYDYKVTIVKQKQVDYSTFINWANASENFRLTNSCKQETSRYHSIPSYFYVKGEKNLTMAKIHLGNSIHRIEKVINPASRELIV